MAKNEEKKGKVEKVLEDVSKKIKLEGVIVNHSIETEGSWKIRIETTEIRRLGLYELFMEQLRLVLTTMDSAWSELAHERNLHKDEQFLKEEKEGKKKAETRITRDYVEFISLPQALTNSLKYIRSLVYNAINKYAIKVPLSEEVGQEGVKFRSKNLYIVPRSLFKNLADEIDRINEYVDALNHRVGKISQINEEDEVGKYSMEDFFHSPYFKKLRNLSVSMMLLQDIAHKEIFKNMLPKAKKELVATIANGGDIKPVLDKYIKDEKFKEEALSLYDRARNFFDAQTKHYIRPVSINPLFIDMSPQRIDEWLRDDPVLADKVRQQAHSYVKVMVEQLVSSTTAILEKVRNNIKRYAKLGASGAIIDELQTLSNKFEALGLSADEMTELTQRLMEGQQDSEELLDITYRVDNMLDSLVSSAGAEMGNVVEEEGMGIASGTEEEMPTTSGADIVDEEEGEEEPEM